jgi:hypothetical protein
MAQLSVFYQACPVCGRSLRIPVEAYGRKVTCVHCGGEFRSDEKLDEKSGESRSQHSLTALPLGFGHECLPTASSQ